MPHASEGDPRDAMSTFTSEWPIREGYHCDEFRVVSWFPVRHHPTGLSALHEAHSLGLTPSHPDEEVFVFRVSLVGGVRCPFEGEMGGGMREVPLGSSDEHFWRVEWDREWCG